MYALLAEHAGAIRAYVGLHIAGSHALLPFLLVPTIFSAQLRHPLLINLFVWSTNVPRRLIATTYTNFTRRCVSGIIFGVLSLLIFYAGGYDHAVSRSLCLAQAAVIRATNPLVTSAALMLVHHTWLSVKASIEENKVYTPKRLALDPMYQITMIVFPYILLIFFVLAGTATVIKAPEAVTLTRRVFYCATSHGGYSVFAACVTAVIIMCTACVEVLLGLALWRVLTKSSASALHLIAEDAPFDLSFALRVFASGLYVLVSCGFAITAVLKRNSIESDVFGGTVAIFVAVAFGTRKAVWSFWSGVPLAFWAIVCRSR